MKVQILKDILDLISTEPLLTKGLTALQFLLCKVSFHDSTQIIIKRGNNLRKFTAFWQLSANDAVLTKYKPPCQAESKLCESSKQAL